MVQAPATEVKADPQRAGACECAHESRSVRWAPRAAASLRGNQAVLSDLAIQRATDTTPVSIDDRPFFGVGNILEGTTKGWSYYGWRVK